jgi:hypothetical protein
VNAANIGETYSIVDISGRIVVQGTIQNIKTELTIESLSVGSYFFRLSGERMKYLRFIKQ